MSKNFALPTNGGKVLCATCYDPDHPSSNIISDDTASFWPTTGMQVDRTISTATVGGGHRCAPSAVAKHQYAI